MMMRELIYSLQWLLLRELSCEEGSFSICQKMKNKKNKKRKENLILAMFEVDWRQTTNIREYF